MPPAGTLRIKDYARLGRKCDLLEIVQETVLGCLGGISTGAGGLQIVWKYL